MLLVKYQSKKKKTVRNGNVSDEEQELKHKAHISSTLALNEMISMLNFVKCDFVSTGSESVHAFLFFFNMIMISKP